MEEEEYQLLYFQMIAAAGESKSAYMEALQEVKEKNFEKADELIKEGAKHFSIVHDMHMDLLQKECEGDKIEFSVLMVHVEDQMMSVEVVKILVLEFYELYKLIFSKE